MGADATLEVTDPEPGIRLLRFNQPEKLNPLGPPMVRALTDELDRLVHDADTRVVVLTGAGRGFCSGVDLDTDPFVVGFEGSEQRVWTEIQRWYSGLVVRLRRIPQVVVAAVNGPCAGGGFSLAMAADVRFCDPSAVFVAAQIDIGQAVSEMGASWLLPRIVGGRAAEILLTGRRVGAAEAERIGLVTAVSPPGAVLDTAMETARVVAAKAPLALRLSKEALNASAMSPSLEAAITMEDRTQILCVLSDDLREAWDEFRRKRSG